MRRAAAGTIVVAVALALAACGAGDDAEPGVSPAPSTTSGTGAETRTPDGEALVVDVTLSDDGPTPRGDRVDVEVGQTVRLVVTNQSSEADEVHVHSDPEHSLDLAAGASGELELTVDRPGQVAVESHHSDTVIVQLVVS